MVSTDSDQSSDKKLLLMGGLMFLGLTILAGGLWRVQILNSDLYEERKNQQYYVTVRVPAVRGKILDVEGRALADNRTSFTLNLYIERLRELYQAEYYPVKDQVIDSIIAEEGASRGLRGEERAFINKTARFNVMKRLVDEMGEIMGENLTISQKEFEDHYYQKRSMPLPIMTDISLAQASRFMETLQVPPGFDIDEQPMRKYPFGDLASQTLGHMRRIVDHAGNDEIADHEFEAKYQLPDFEGVTGLERHFESDLRGTPGVMKVMVNYLGYRTESNIAVQPQPGSNIHLTLDADIQRVAQDTLEKVMNQTKGAAVVMDAATGDLLALASVPGFDPNKFVPAISSAEYRSYNSPDLKTFMNRCTSERYQPGSVFKIVVAMALLESPDFDPDAIIETSKVYRRGEGAGRISINDTAPADEYDLIKAFKKSSNYYFVETGINLGREKIVDLAAQFGFDQRTSLPIMQGAAGILPTNEYISKHSSYRWTTGRTANLSIGQGEIDVTPLHVAQMMGCIANGGRIPEPRLVKRIESQNPNNPQSSNRTFPVRSAGYVRLKERTLTYLKKAMLADVVERDGTGYLANVPGMSIGGKTGTAASSQRRTTWFASMAPMDNPRFVVVVMVEDGDSGGRSCAPVAARIYEALQKKYFTNQGQLQGNILTSAYSPSGSPTQIERVAP